MAEPREAGTPGAARVRAALRERLVARGWVVEEHRFAFAPAALNAFPLFGAGLGWLALLELLLLVLPPLPAWGALFVWLVGLAALGAFAYGLGLGQTPLGGGVREDATLVARRSGARPRRWLVAHLDTKAQRQSTAGRIVAVWANVAAALVLSGCAVWRAVAGPVPLGAAAAGVALALVAAALAGRGRLHGSSPGARDNASGLVAVLTAADALRDPEVGLLLPGAEEFGLIGARTFAAAYPDRLRESDVINVDTLDDEGKLYLVGHGAAGQALAARLAPGMAATGLEVRTRRLPMGILVDGIPLARAGARAVTIGRLTWGTLRRIHTPRDHAEGFAFDTAARVGAALGRVLGGAGGTAGPD